MRINDSLALFGLGALTLVLTLGFLYMMSTRQDSGSAGAKNEIIDEIKRDLASLKRGDAAGAATAMAALDREITATLTASGEYLAGGTFDEQRHIALLERLQFYRGLSSISEPQKRAIASTLKDLDRLATLKESVALQVRLSGEIDAAVTEAHLFVSRDSSDAGAAEEAQRLLNSLEGFYRIRGLSPEQNRKLKNAIAALSSIDTWSAQEPRAVASAQPSTSTSTVTSTAPARQDIPPVLKQYLDENKGARISSEPKKRTASSASRQAAAPAPSVQAEEDLPQETTAYAPAEAQALDRIAGIAQAEASVAPAASPVAAPPVPFVDPARMEDTLAEVRQYLVRGEYDPVEHDRLTKRLEGYVDIADEFSPEQLNRLLESHENMKVFEAAIKEFL